MLFNSTGDNNVWNMWIGMSSLIPDSSKIPDKLALLAHNIVHKSLEKTTIIQEDLDPCGFHLYCPKFDMLRSNNGVKFGKFMATTAILKGKEKERELSQKEHICGFISSKEKTTVSVKVDFLKIQCFSQEVCTKAKKLKLQLLLPQKKTTSQWKLHHFQSNLGIFQPAMLAFGGGRLWSLRKRQHFSYSKYACHFGGFLPTKLSNCFEDHIVLSLKLN